MPAEVDAPVESATETLPVVDAERPGQMEPATDTELDAAADSVSAAETVFQDSGGTAGEILAEEATAGAPVAELQAEQKLLETIGKGVSLSLAECQGVEDCEPTVNKAELQQLVKTVEKRINGLVQRQSESADAAVDDLLIAYAIVRDTYTQQLERLGELTPEDLAGEEGELFGEETPAEAPAEATALPDAFSIFEDVDESLTDESAPAETPEPELGTEDPM